MVGIERAPCPVKDCQIPVDVQLRSHDGVLIGAHQANLSNHGEGFPDPNAISDSSEPVDLTKNAETQIPVGVQLKSHDGVLISAHQVNLSNYGEGLPDANAISDSSEPVDLTENAETLKLLMHFVHKPPYPNVSLLQDDLLFDLARASEKYMVHSAMSMCSMCIQLTVSKYPIRALGYAVKHGYCDIADIAAPLTMYKSMETMKSGLNDDGALFAWLQYRTVYMSRLNEVLTRPKQWPVHRHVLYLNCPSWAAYKGTVISGVLGYFVNPTEEGFTSLFDKPFKPCRWTFRCDSCGMKNHPDFTPEGARQVWRGSVLTLINDIPPLSTYM